MKLLVRDAELSVEQISRTVRDLESVLALADTRALDFSEPTREILRGLHARLQTEQWSRLHRGADSTAQPAYPPLRDASWIARVA